MFQGLFPIPALVEDVRMLKVQYVGIHITFKNQLKPSTGCEEITVQDIFELCPS